MHVTGLNTLSGSIICPSICPSFHPVLSRPVYNFCICINFQCGVQIRDAFIPALGSKGPQWFPVNLICISVSLSLCLVVCVTFWWSKRAEHNCAQCMWPQATGSNPPSGSIIFPSVCWSGRLRDIFQFLYLYIRPSIHLFDLGPFAIFVLVLISSIGVQHWDTFIPTLGSSWD